MLERVLVNVVGRVRRETFNGRSYLVAPASSINPGVLPGSRGPLYYPPDECARNAKDWDGMPIVLRHPTDPLTNDHIPAGSDGVWDRQGLGEVKNSRFDGKLRHEMWFDEEAVRNHDHELPDGYKILPRLLNGTPIELSTGLYTDNEDAPGTFNGRPYTHVARNYRPDHIAVLPDQTGACSVNDGCGVLVNQGTSQDEVRCGVLVNQSSEESQDVVNVFCPTGVGGGVDATCSPGQDGGGADKGYKGSGTKEDPARCGSDIKLAAKLLSQGMHIRLKQPDQVATLVTKMQNMILAAVASGKPPPSFDLCKVTAKDTNLFCQESLGIPRVQMPQMRGQPMPGTYAATLPAGKNSGKVDLTQDFLDHLKSQGIKSEETEVRASHLRASQSEIVGARVVQLVNEAKAGDRDLREKPIFVTKDNYIVDGHHHWAADVAYGYEKGKDYKIPVYKLDMDIGKALTMANDFTKKMGLAPKSGSATSNELTPAQARGLARVDPSLVTVNEAGRLIVNPFVSEPQRRYLWANEPEIAEAWAHGEHTSEGDDHKMPAKTGRGVKGPLAKAERKSQRGAKPKKAETHNVLVANARDLFAAFMEWNSQRTDNAGQPRGTVDGKYRQHPPRPDTAGVHSAAKAHFEPASEEEHEDDAAAELVGVRGPGTGDDRTALEPEAGEYLEADDHQSPKSGPKELEMAAKKVGLKPVKNQYPGGMSPAGMQSPSPHEATKSATASTLMTEHEGAFGHAKGAMDASKSEDPAAAAGLHKKAAAAHEKEATAMRSDGDQAGAEDHDYAAALHRKAASMHAATMNASIEDKTATRNERRPSMTREQKVKALTANCRCDKDKAALNGLSDETLDALIKNAKPDSSNADGTGSGTRQAGGEEEDDDVRNDPEWDDDAEADVKGGKKKVANVSIENRLTPEELEVWNDAKQTVRGKKVELVRRLIANVSDPEQRKRLGGQFMGKKLAELKDMVAILGPVPTRNRGLLEDDDVGEGALFVGNAAPDFSANAATTDGQDAEDDGMAPPTLNWAQIRDEERKQRTG